MTKRTDSGRELTLADHVPDFDSVQRHGRGCEGFEPQHRACSLLDETVVLLNDIVQVFPSDHLNGDRRAKALKHLVDGLNARGVGAAFVDDDLSRQAIGFQHSGEELGGSLFVATPG